MAAGDFEVLDERFTHCVKRSPQVERLFTGCRWRRAWPTFPHIPNDRMLRFDETTGAVGVFRAPAGYANGNTVDREGRLVSCEHGGRRVTRTEHDGSV